MPQTVRMGIRLLLILVLMVNLIIFSVGTVSAATIWHVDVDNCPGPGDGTGGNPFCSIQTAIDAASDGLLYLSLLS